MLVPQLEKVLNKRAVSLEEHRVKQLDTRRSQMKLTEDGAANKKNTGLRQLHFV
jgi:hypothetical protein